jgi:hypothetical protein
MNRPASAEAIFNSNEILEDREQFFNPQVSLDTHQVFCADKRGIIGLSDYVHILGGSLNAPYNLLVLKETDRPASVDQPLGDFAGSLVPVMRAKDVVTGVHSDRKTEQGGHIRLDRPEGPVGCVYAQQRGVISRLIRDNILEFIDVASTLRAELFTDPPDRTFARAVGAAHGRLAERQGILPGGRSAVLDAASKGAATGVVDGETNAKTVGIINLAGGSYRSAKALEAGLPAYVQDTWASEKIFERLKGLYPGSTRHALIAEIIDTIGALRALGVAYEDIAVRN